MPEHLYNTKKLICVKHSLCSYNLPKWAYFNFNNVIETKGKTKKKINYKYLSW